MIEEPSTGVTYTIGGVKVEFPLKAYPSQISMMDKVIRGCHRAQNCLLESPTGSGKTLALLCGAVAWQKAEAKRLQVVAEAEYREAVQKFSELQQNHLHNIQKKLLDTNQEKNPGGSEQSTFHVGDSDAEESEIFRPCLKKPKTDSASPTNTMREKLNKEISEITPITKPVECGNTDAASWNIIEGPPELKIPRPPKIYFGTRTHKQIAQIVKELRRTAYSDVNTTLLSSRNYSCIHERGLLPHVNKNELCQELMDPTTATSCEFYNGVKRFAHHAVLREYGVPSVWDLEDLVKFGKKKIVCPYYTARELMDHADVIFCPYNYIVDPLIRQSMNITLRGAILILDEAHNIEDTCREAASFSVHQQNIFDAIKDCEETLQKVGNKVPYQKLTQILCSVSHWIDLHKNEITDISDYDKSKLMMFGTQAVESFEDYDFGPGEHFREFQATLTEIAAEKQKTAEENGSDVESISAATKSLAEGLILVLGFLYDERYTCDYHVALTKSLNLYNEEAPEPDAGGWFSSRRKERKQLNKWNYTLHFWCLNPATVFNDIKEKARSVILTSGTLSPMNSFQSELGATFPITLEANHVIDPNQCWIGSLGSGPNNVCLDGKFASTNTYQYQDEIGQIVSHICSLVPNGILFFVPSYSLLDKLKERWACTGVLNGIAKHKKIVWEPRRSGEFEYLMKEFYQAIEESADSPVGRGVTGALFIAVCRGKVSEGLDFADKNARVVITIGIPFPSIKDAQVMLKKSYNDQHQHSKGLLGGRDWYQIQAYRALNQALGRCIRHRNDWGAILLIDNRFSNDQYYKSLSKWVRNKIRHHHGYDNMINQLNAFIQTRLRIDEKLE